MAEYRFDDIAINSTEKKKPVESDKEHYLGLEHLDSGTFKVSRFGSEVAPIGDKLIMKKGDVLFGKRRAYQKKVAIAPFDGIFSAHGMVLRPKEDVIDKDFFPLFIASDYFLDAAIKISVGSLSPTINWRDLKELKFNLPELDEQKKLAEVLWQIVDTMESYKKLLTKTDEMVKAKFVEMFGEPEKNDKQLKIVTLRELSKFPLSYGAASAATKYDGETRYIRITDIDDNGNLINNLTSPSEYDESFLLNEGDLLFARTGNTVGKTFLYKKKYGKSIYAGFLIRLIPNLNIVIPDYIYYFTNTDFYKYFVEKTKRTVAQPNINAKEYGNLNICLPSLELQKIFVTFANRAEESKAAIQASLDSISAVYKKIIAENLGGSN